jgi:undecaprenyl diphosphate synthase
MAGGVPEAGESELEAAVRTRPVPRHIAIIMDGNGRWARRRGLPRVAGHRAGAGALREVVRACGDLGVKYLSLFAFSTENWRRPRAEVSALMRLLSEYLRREVDELNANGVALRAIGATADLPPGARRNLERAIERTRGNGGLCLILALNYGSRREIAGAARELCRLSAAGEIDWRAVDEAAVERHLYTSGIPDPDLLIRPSGEMRLSNFLLWQAAYAELYVTPVLWPDFRRADLVRAILDYQRRERRFGGVGAGAGAAGEPGDGAGAPPAR